MRIFQAAVMDTQGNNTYSLNIQNSSHEGTGLTECGHHRSELVQKLKKVMRFQKNRNTPLCPVPFVRGFLRVFL
jgi:hypothetical protein